MIEPLEAPHFATPEECLNCPYQTPCITLPPGNQAGHRITPVVVLDCVYRGATPQGDIPELLDNLETQARRAADARYGAGAGQGLTGGLRNSRGEWLENILSVIFRNVSREFDDGNPVIVKLPNAAQLRFLELYEPRANRYLEELFVSLRERGIEMTMSNPDFVCVTNLPAEIAGNLRNPMYMNAESITNMDQAYQALRGHCTANSIPFVLTVKTSVRPDRRYQIVHEANVVKSLVAHLAGRFWRRDLYTAFYAMIASNVSASDREVLRNPATYSLVQVSWNPVALVDQVFQIGSVEGVQNTIRELLQQHLGPDE